MNVTEHLLACLAEECSEVTKDAMKSQRFGLDDRNVLEPNGPTNRERILQELNDLMGVIDLLIDHGDIPAHWGNGCSQVKKKEKVSKFMEYATKVGALKP